MAAGAVAGPRLAGVDVARGLAVLGMFGAHVGATGDFDWPDPASWAGVVDGRSSILFALLAGVSLAILSGRDHPVTGAALEQARTRIVVRSGAIFALGIGLISLDTNVAVILPYYGLLFLITIPFLPWRSAPLFVVAAVLAIVTPILVAALLIVIGDPETLGLGIVPAEFFVTGPYPVLIWTTFFIAGLGVGRLDLAALGTQVRLLIAGIVLAVTGYTSGEVAGEIVGRLAVPAARATDGIDWRTLATTEPHSGSPFEVVGSTGFAIAVLAACLLLSRVIRVPLVPVAAVGAMALTAYTVHLVAITVFGVPVPGKGESWTWLVFVIVALVGCTLWTLVLGRGPLERILTLVSTRIAAAGTPVPAERRPPEL